MNKLRLFDDDFMIIVLIDKTCVEVVLSVILGRCIHIKRVYSQAVLKSLIGRSTELDIVAKDISGIIYNFEV